MKLIALKLPNLPIPLKLPPGISGIVWLFCVKVLVLNWFTRIII